MIPTIPLRWVRPGAFAALTVLAVLLAGCGDDKSPAASLANPASVFCVQEGGKVEIETEPGGQRGICVLPDGRRVDEWEHYRSRSSTTTSTMVSTSSTTSVTAPPTRCSARDLSPELPDDAGLPAVVADMRREIGAAATRCDYDALDTLVDLHGRSIRYTWGEGSDPVGAWRLAEERGESPGPMRALRLLLALPAARSGPAGGVVQYVWPAAFAVDHPTDAQLQEIASTGLYTMATLRSWVASGTNYLGYRIFISAEGDWNLFVAGD